MGRGGITVAAGNPQSCAGGPHKPCAVHSGHLCTGPRKSRGFGSVSWKEVHWKFRGSSRSRGVHGNFTNLKLTEDSVKLAEEDSVNLQKIGETL